MVSISPRTTNYSNTHTFIYVTACSRYNSPLACLWIISYFSMMVKFKSLRHFVGWECIMNSKRNNVIKTKTVRTHTKQDIHYWYNTITGFPAICHMGRLCAHALLHSYSTCRTKECRIIKILLQLYIMKPSNKVQV